jgi:hypothetical protein
MDGRHPILKPMDVQAAMDQINLARPIFRDVADQPPLSGPDGMLV